MLLASEAREMTKRSFRAEAVQYAIQTIENEIKDHATKGDRSCHISFHSQPGKYKEFVQKYGEEYQDDYYKQYDVEIEVKEYFIKNGFTFKLVTDDICGGVRLNPYWAICW